MKLPKPRLTIRRLMVAVAIVGVVLGSVGWMERRKARFGIEFTRHMREWWNLGPDDSPKAHYHKKLLDKYYRAAHHPWLPVAPDPPEPE